MVRALMLASALIAARADATTFWAETRITGVAAVGSDPDHPDYSDMIWLGLADESWLPARCRRLPGALFPAGDKALLALALHALDAGEMVTIKATETGAIGDYCRIYQLTLHAGRMVSGAHHARALSHLPDRR